MKKTYYQAQSSKDGKTWTAFNAQNKYDIVTDYEEIKTVYDRMLKLHAEIWNNCKYHRIVKYEVKEIVLDVEP